MEYFELKCTSNRDAAGGVCAEQKFIPNNAPAYTCNFPDWETGRSLWDDRCRDDELKRHEADIDEM